MPFDSTPIVTESHDVTIMRQIRNKIAAGHWCKGTLEDRRGNHCIIGWWMYFDGNPTAMPTTEMQLLAYHRAASYLGPDIVTINDERKTTKNYMVNLLDEAIRKELV